MAISIPTTLLSFTVGTGLAYTIAQAIVIAADVSDYMTAIITAYNSTTGVMTATVTYSVGSGTYTAWVVNLDGAVGAQGSTGPTGASFTGPQGNTGPTGTAGGVGATGNTGATGPAGDTGPSVATAPISFTTPAGFPGANFGGNGTVSWCAFTDTVGDYVGYDNSTGVTIQAAGNAGLRTLTNPYTAANGVNGVAIIGSFVYVCYWKSSNTDIRIFRFTKNNLAAGGTLMTVSGASLNTGTHEGSVLMGSNGTNLYFTLGANQSGFANTYDVSSFSISGTTITYITTVACGSTSTVFGGNMAADSSGNIYGLSSADGEVRKYNSSGVLQTTSALGYSTGSQLYLSFQINNNIYIGTTIASGVQAGSYYIFTP
jgi:hypothetical protein